MIRDLRDTPLFREAEELYRTLHRAGAQLISDASEVSTNGTHAAFVGSIVAAADTPPTSRICLTELTTGDTRVLSIGPNTDRSPRFSPDGGLIAFLSDRDRVGDFQLCLLDLNGGAVRGTPHVDGWVEYLQWSPNGRRVLLGVAGHGADVAGGHGAVKSKPAPAAVPSWLPQVESGDDACLWRRAWVYELGSDRVREIGPSHVNVWECVWRGNDAIAAIVSDGPGEDQWYSARLVTFEGTSCQARELYRPEDQIGGLAVSPCGQHLAVIDAICSDRCLVAGDLHLIDFATQKSYRASTMGVDVSFLEWRSDRKLLLAGHRGMSTAIGVYDRVSDLYTETWCSSDLTTAGIYATVAGLGDDADCVFISEGFLRAPEIGVVRSGKYSTVTSFDVGGVDSLGSVATVRQLNWNAPDGLEIEGWLLRPLSAGPHPLVMSLHGGPVWHWRPTWLGRRAISVLLLLKHGYAVFLPNPRGSSGRGKEFARKVKGDLNGADTHDCLSGLDYLVEDGMVDPQRIGVTGHSYGGNLTAWMITQDPRFAAAIPVCPHTNQVSEHLTSNIPAFLQLFLADTYRNPGGKYFERSPIMHAHKAKTPTLNICGALDRCTPPGEALQFHNALRENGVPSVLLTYPEEGHGIRNAPAIVDCAARIVAWLEEHMPAGTH